MSFPFENRLENSAACSLQLFWTLVEHPRSAKITVEIRKIWHQSDHHDLQRIINTVNLLSKDNYHTIETRAQFAGCGHFARDITTKQFYNLSYNNAILYHVLTCIETRYFYIICSFWRNETECKEWRYHNVTVILHKSSHYNPTMWLRKH